MRPPRISNGSGDEKHTEQPSQVCFLVAGQLSVVGEVLAGKNF